MVISSYFKTNSLVSQQINSFNEFVQSSMQELVDENSQLILEQNMQHTGKENDQAVGCCPSPLLERIRADSRGPQRRYTIKFGQIYLANPTVKEPDGAARGLKPAEARARNLT